MNEPTARIRRWWQRRRTIYGCGSCRSTFKTEAAMKAHQPCPLYLLEREVAEWNAETRLRVYRYDENKTALEALREAAAEEFGT